MRGRPRKFFTRPQDSADPRYAEELIAEANLRFDLTHPEDDAGYYTLPLPAFMDLAPPGFCKDGLRSNDLDPIVWDWLNRKREDQSQTILLLAEHSPQP